MLPTRRITAVFIGTFLVGALVGGLVTLTFQDVRFSHFLSSTGDPKNMASRINRKYVQEYGLTSDEQTRIAPLTQDMTQRLYLLRRQFGVDILATLDDYHQKVGEQLSPEQRQSFQRANEKRKARMSTMFQLDSPGSDQASR